MAYHCVLKSEHLEKVRKAQWEMEICIDSSVHLGTIAVELKCALKPINTASLFYGEEEAICQVAYHANAFCMASLPALRFFLRALIKLCPFILLISPTALLLYCSDLCMRM